MGSAGEAPGKAARLRQEKAAATKATAMAKVDADLKAAREKTARLKLQRLQKEAADKEAAGAVVPAKPGKKPSRTAD